ncbi:MAG TPA: hypothetical protein VM261_33735 [Kofleriaceae bacterium]|nr:hypothetical protein [Kofleriaceae bacterium]
MTSMQFPKLIRLWLAALALVVVTSATAWATELPVVVDRGAIVVRAAAGLESEATVLADRAASTLPAIAEDLPDLPRPRKIEIRLVRDTEELTSVSPPGHGAPRWAAGVAFPDEGVLALAMRRGAQLHDTGKTLDHELAHLLLGAAVRNAPRWLHEGFAWQHAQDLGLDRVETLAGMAWFGNIAPLEALESGFPAEEAPASRAYAQSYDFVGFLAHRGRWADADDDGDRWPFRYFLRAMAQGKDVDAAAREAYGVGIEDLYDEWRADLVRRYLLVPAGVFASGLWLIAAVLLVLAWRRRRRMAKVRLAQMAAEEAARSRMFETDEQPDAPPEDDDPLRDPPPPRWMN